MRHAAASSTQNTASNLGDAGVEERASGNGYPNHPETEVSPRFEIGSHDWLVQPESASSTPSVAAHSAAIKWLGVLTGDASSNSLPDASLAQNLDNGFLRGDHGEQDDTLTPLQRATRAVDERTGDHAADVEASGKPILPWQSTENITLLEDEQILFGRFLRRICSWVCDPLTMPLEDIDRL